MYLLLGVTYSASVRFLPRVSPHVNDEHVLCLKRLLLPRATDPLADERLLVGPDVVHVQVLKAGVGRIGSGFAFYSPIYGSPSSLPSLLPVPRSPTPLKSPLAPLSESEAEAVRIAQTRILLLECDWVVNLSSFPLPDCHPPRRPRRRQQRQTCSGPIIIKEVLAWPTDHPFCFSSYARASPLPSFTQLPRPARPAASPPPPLSSPLRSFTSVIKMPRPLSSSPRTIRPPPKRGERRKRERGCRSAAGESRERPRPPPISLSVPHLY